MRSMSHPHPVDDPHCGGCEDFMLIGNAGSSITSMMSAFTRRGKLRFLTSKRR